MKNWYWNKIAQLSWVMQLRSIRQIGLDKDDTIHPMGFCGAIKKAITAALLVLVAACGGSDFGTTSALRLIQFNASYLSITEDGSEPVGVRLGQAPTSTVTVFFEISDDDDNNFLLASSDDIDEANEDIRLVFTEDNWQEIQDIYIFSALDEDGSDSLATLVVSRVSSADPIYRDLDVETVNLTVEQDDEIEKTLTISGSSNVLEGQTVPYKIELGGKVSTDTVFSVLISGAATLDNGNSLINITIPANSDEQTISVKFNEVDQASSAQIQVTFIVGDTIFTGLSETISVSIIDNPSGGGTTTGSLFVTAPSSISAGGSGSFSISLVGYTLAPTEQVLISIQESSTSFLQISRNVQQLSAGNQSSISLPFTATNPTSNTTVTVLFTMQTHSVQGLSQSLSTTKTITITAEGGGGGDPPVVSFESITGTIDENGGQLTAAILISPIHNENVVIQLSNIGFGSDSAAFSATANGADVGSIMIIPASTARLEVVLTSLREVDSNQIETIVLTKPGAGDFEIDSQRSTLTLTVRNAATVVLPTITIDAAPATINEGSASTVSVRSSRILQESITGTITLSGSATQNSDYQFKNPSSIVQSSTRVPFTIFANESSAAFRLEAIEDAVTDVNEEVIMTLSVDDPTKADLGATSSAQVTITEEELPPQITLAVGASSIDEGDSFTVRAVVDKTVSSPIVVNLAHSGTIPRAKVTGLGPLTISANSTESSPITVSVSSDNREDPVYTLIVEVDSISGGGTPTPVKATTGAEHTVTVRADVPTYTFAVTPQEVTEGGRIAITATSDMELRANTVFSITYAGSANSDDFITRSATLVMLSGTRESTVEVVTKTGDQDSATENVQIALALSDSSRGRISGTTSFNVTVQEPAAKNLRISVVGSSSAFDEGEEFQIQVTASDGIESNTPYTISKSSNAPTQVSRVTSSDPESGTISANETKTIRYTVTQDSTYDENQQQITFTLTTSDSTVSINPSGGLNITLNADEPPPQISLRVDPSSIDEGGSFTVQASVSRQVSSPITVNLDYDGSIPRNRVTGPSSLTINANSTQSSPITVSVSSDNREDPAYALIVEVSTISGGGTPTPVRAPSGAEQTVTVRANEPTYSFAVTPQEVTEGGRIAITATSDMELRANTVFNITYSGSANSDDFITRSATLVILSGTREGTIEVVTKAGDQDDVTENVRIALALSDSSRGRISGTTSFNVTVQEPAAKNLSISLLGASSSFNEGDQFQIQVAASDGIESNTSYTISKSSNASAQISRVTSSDPESGTISANGAKTIRYNVLADSTFEQDQQEIVFTLTTTDSSVSLTPVNGRLTVRINADQGSTVEVTTVISTSTTHDLSEGDSSDILYRVSSNNQPLSDLGLANAIVLKACLTTSSQNCTPQDRLSSIGLSLDQSVTHQSTYTEFKIRSNDNSNWEADQEFRVLVGWSDSTSTSSQSHLDFELQSNVDIVKMRKLASDVPDIEITGGTEKTVSASDNVSVVFRIAGSASVPNSYPSGLVLDFNTQSGSIATPTSGNVTIPTGSSQRTASFAISSNAQAGDRHVYRFNLPSGSTQAPLSLTLAIPSRLSSLGSLSASVQNIQGQDPTTQRGGNYVNFNLNDISSSSISDVVFRSEASSSAINFEVEPYRTSSSTYTTAFPTHIWPSGVSIKAHATAAGSSDIINSNNAAAVTSTSTPVYRYHNEQLRYLGSGVALSGDGQIALASAPRKRSSTPPHHVLFKYAAENSRWNPTVTQLQDSGYNQFPALVDISANGKYMVTTAVNSSNKVYAKITSLTGDLNCSGAYFDTSTYIELDQGRLTDYYYIDINNNGTVVMMGKDSSLSTPVLSHRTASCTSSASMTTTSFPFGTSGSFSFITVPTFDLVEEADTIILGTAIHPAETSCLYEVPISQLGSLISNPDNYLIECKNDSNSYPLSTSGGDHKGKVHLSASHNGSVVAARLNFDGGSTEFAVWEKSGSSWRRQDLWTFDKNPKDNSNKDARLDGPSSDMVQIAASQNSAAGTSVELSGNGKILAVTMAASTLLKPIYFYGSGQLSSNDLYIQTNPYARVTVYAYVGSSWQLVSELASPYQDGEYTTIGADNRFGGFYPSYNFMTHGIALSESGDTLIVGSNGYDIGNGGSGDHGAIFVF